MKISPFQYTDYHKFLNDFFQAEKRRNPNINSAQLCESTGIKSRGHLSLILNGKAHISTDLAMKFAEILGLKKRKLEYFLAMVAFNQEKKSGPKMDHFEKLISFRESAIYRVKPHLYKYYDKWYHSVIRALLDIIDVKDDFKEIAKLVVPVIRPDQAKTSVELLADLELIERDASGFFRPSRKSIDTGVAETSVTINQFVLSMLDRAREAMDRFKRDERIFSSVTLGVSQDGYDKICAELREFRRRAADIAQETPADRVVQVNFQMFPVSKLMPAKKDSDNAAH